MPTRHLFADEHATHGRTLCGLDVIAPDGPRKPRTYRACVYCQNKLRQAERDKPVASKRRSYHDRLAED